MSAAPTRSALRLFRPRFSATLWLEAVSFLRDALAGRDAQLQLRPAIFRPLGEEVMDDLRYGRE